MNAFSSSKTAVCKIVTEDNLEEPQDLVVEKSLPVLLTTLFISPREGDGRKLAESLLAIPNLTLTQASATQVDASHFTGTSLLILLLPSDVEVAMHLLENYRGKCRHFLVVGESPTPELMREAMKAGAKDFLPIGGTKDEIYHAIFDIAQSVADEMVLAPTLAVVNSKGGCGSSFLSSAIADLLARRNNQDKVALIDGDQVQAGLSYLLNVEPDYFFHNALSQADELDDSALIGMMSQLDNLHLLPSKPFSQQDSHSLTYLQLPQLLFKVRCHYKAVVADLSRGPESWTNKILMDANHILLVVQENLASIRSATATVRHLVYDLGINKSNIHIVFNRYSQNKSGVDVSDIKKTTGIDSVFTVCNDFKRVNACLDEGKRLSQFATKESVTKDIKKICDTLLPENQDVKEKGFWSKIFR